MNKQVEGLRLLADILEIDPPENMLWADHPLTVNLSFPTRAAVDAAAEKMLELGATSYRENDPTLLIAYLAGSPGDYFPGVELFLGVHAE